MNISRTFIERPVATSVLFVCILFFGWLAFNKLPVNDLPNVDFPTITVEATWEGAAPEVEVTLERAQGERGVSADRLDAPARSKHGGKPTTEER